MRGGLALPTPAGRGHVLIPLVERSDGLTVLLTQRTANLSSHSGQIAFPGGKSRSAGRPCTQTTALGQINLDPRLVRVIGNLPVYTTGSAFIVTPVVALVEPVFELKPNPTGSRCVQVPLAYLMNLPTTDATCLRWEGMRRGGSPCLHRSARGAPSFWGATAGMLRNPVPFPGGLKACGVIASV